MSLYIQDDEKKIKLNEAYIIIDGDNRISVEIVNGSYVFRLQTNCTIENFREYYKMEKNNNAV